MHATHRNGGRYLVAAAALGALIAGSFLPSPLYELYRRVWNLSAADIGLAFAAYAGALIPTLLFYGGISDSLGRRRTLHVALAIAVLSALVLAFAHGLWYVIVARALQGVAVGVGIGTATVAIREWMNEASQPFAPEIASVAGGVGGMIGALLAGFLAQYAPYPMVLPYLVYIVLLAIVAALVATAPSRPHIVPAAHTRFPSVPRAIRRPFSLACAQVFLCWAAFALFFSLVPTFLSKVMGLHNLVVGALVVLGVQSGAVLISLFGRRMRPTVAIVIALLSTGAGTWSLLVAAPLHSLALVGLAAFLVGVGGGLSLVAGLTIVEAVAPAEHRAEVTSAFYVATYLGFSLPTLAVGFVATFVGLSDALTSAAIVLGIFAVATMLLTSEKALRVDPFP